MRVEPEQMLEQNRIASKRRIEDSDVREPLERQQQHRHCDYRCAQYEYQAGRVMRPDKQRQPEPRQPRRSHCVYRDNEIEPGQNRREPGDEHADAGQYHVAVRIRRAVRSIKRPTSIDTAHQDRDYRE